MHFKSEATGKVALCADIDKDFIYKNFMKPLFATRADATDLRPLSSFPIFRQLKMEDKDAILRITANFKPYSDFNFSSLWAWNIKNIIEISTLEGNLVVKFTDYLSGEAFFSILGKNNIENCICSIIEIAKEKGLSQVLRLVPEETALCLKNKEKFLVKENRDGFDYIYSLKDLISYKGVRFGPKRNFVNRFNKFYKGECKVIDIQDRNIQNKLLEVFERWTLSKNKTKAEVKNELAALIRIFSIINTVSVGAFVEGELIGFTINEIIDSKYSILHFEKGDTKSYVGLFPFLMQKTAQILMKSGAEYLNYEQDLGIEGLRKGKLSYYPIKFLKKYDVRLVDNSTDFDFVLS